MKKLLILICTFVLITGCSAGKTADRDNVHLYDNKTERTNPTTSHAVNEDGGGYYDGSDSLKAVSEENEKLVYKGSVTMETKKYEDFTDELNNIINKYHGLTEAMREQTNSYGSYNRTLYITLRIPAENFNNFINDLRQGSGSVIDVSTRVDNITKNYNNNEIEIEALETQHARLLQLLSEAADLDAIIKLEERIGNVEMRLTQLKQYRNEMDSDVTYSTIDLYINEVREYSETSYWQKLANAFGNSWIEFVSNMGGLLIDVVYAVPTIITVIVGYLLLKKPVKKLYYRIREGRKPKLIKEETEIKDHE